MKGRVIVSTKLSVSAKFTSIFPPPPVEPTVTTITGAPSMLKDPFDITGVMPEPYGAHIGYTNLEIFFKVDLWIDTLPTTDEKFFEAFPNGYKSEWNFYDHREAVNFQLVLCEAWGLPDPQKRSCRASNDSNLDV